jgi:hypothetical protein
MHWYMSDDASDYSFSGYPWRPDLELPGNSKQTLGL